MPINRKIASIAIPQDRCPYPLAFETMNQFGIMGSALSERRGEVFSIDTIMSDEFCIPGCAAALVSQVLSAGYSPLYRSNRLTNSDSLRLTSDNCAASNR